MGRGYACLDTRTYAKECDMIHLMTNGKIIDSGSYQELIESNEEFKRMAKNAQFFRNYRLFSMKIMVTVINNILLK